MQQIDRTEHEKIREKLKKGMIDMVGAERQTWELSVRPTVTSLQLDFSTWPSFSSPLPSLLVSPQWIPTRKKPSSSSSSFIPFLLLIVLSFRSHPGQIHHMYFPSICIWIEAQMLMLVRTDDPLPACRVLYTFHIKHPFAAPSCC